MTHTLCHSHNQLKYSHHWTLNLEDNPTTEISESALKMTSKKFDKAPTIMLIFFKLSGTGNAKSKDSRCISKQINAPHPTLRLKSMGVFLLWIL